jgi:hypothetical protein
MSKLPAILVLALVAALPAIATPSARAAQVLIADDRCNGQTIDDASRRISQYDRHAPGSSPPQLLERFGAIAEIIATLNEEREILTSVCSNEAERAAFFARIAAMSASALLLEADVAARLNASCPAAAKAFPTMMLSDAWLALANVVNQEGGTTPPVFADVTARLQTRAQALDLALPAWHDTSQYWRDQIHAKAKAEIATCPSPSPAPTGSAGRILRIVRK